MSPEVTPLSDNLLAYIAGEVEELLSQGKPADYIPALARVDPQQFALCVHPLEGEPLWVGDADTPFTIQSISKVLSLSLAYERLGDKLWARVGREPSGMRFNSIMQLESDKGIPRNPFINAGALVVVDMLLDLLEHPEREMLAFARAISGDREIRYNTEVAHSEMETGHVNAALAHLMRAHGNLNHNPEKVLRLYFTYCSLEMSCRDLSAAFGFLANEGVNPHTKSRLISVGHARRINALMLTSGLYDEAGEFAYRVGLPGKSGVAGAIAAVLPRGFSCAVWSPGLNAKGNSLAGIRALELLTTSTGNSVF